jgi:uncharacterized protein YciI
MADQLPEIYALIWRSNETDATFKQSEFDERIPRLMEWLRGLHAGGHLVGCGGGGFENHAGGLTLIRAADIDEARALSAGTPMNEIGTTEIMVWDVYFADLVAKEHEDRLAAKPS